MFKNAKAEYSLIRNSFVVLAKMTSSFPILLDHHSQMEEAVLALQKREKGTRDDLALLASSYAARLKFIQKSMVEKSVYCGKPDKVKVKIIFTFDNATFRKLLQRHQPQSLMERK